MIQIRWIYILKLSESIWRRSKHNLMSTRALYFLLVAVLPWLRMDAQLKREIATSMPLVPRIIKDTVPKWMCRINLHPHEWVDFQPAKNIDYVLYGPLLSFQSAVSKSVLLEQSDSILKASRFFSETIAKTLRLKKRASTLTVSTFYFDRACANAGLSRRLIYLIKGRKCKLVSDTSFDDSNRLDKEVSTRLHSFYLLPNQFFFYDRAEQAIVLDNITPLCFKDMFFSNSPDRTPASNMISRVLFEVVQRSFPQFIAVGCGCTSPYGEYHVDNTVLHLNHENLYKKYDSLYQDYSEGRWP
jgi:hypothetical protein